MSAVVVFILFVICLVIAIPVSISLGIVAVLPGAFDPSFTASASYVIRSMLGGIDSFPLLAVPMFDGTRKDLTEVIRCVCLSDRKKNCRNPLCGDHHLPVLWRNFRFGTGDRSSCRKYDDPASDRARL